MLGPPGAGKGTQAARLRDALNIPSLSTGHILRTAIKEGLGVGPEAKSYMDAGKLVPDEIIIRVLKDFLDKGENKKNDYILDGMPRTLSQAKILEEMGIEVDAVISMEMSDQAIEDRMKWRRECPKCGAAYNLKTLRPKVEGLCDDCKEKLVIRDDDKPETIRTRLAAYHKVAEPILKFYKDKGKVISVDGSMDIEESTAMLIKILERLD